MRSALFLLTTLLCLKTARSDPITWSAKHVQSLENKGVFDRIEPRKEKKKKKSKSTKEKFKKSKSKSSKKSSSSSSSSSKTPSRSSESSSDDDEKATSTNDDSTNSNVSDGNGNIVDECTNNVIGVSPSTFCVDWVPGIGYSRICGSSETEKRGGEVCNIVSMAWLRALTQQNRQIDLVLTHAGICQDDIQQGPLTQEDINKILPKGFNIVLVQMSGNQIKLALEQAAKAALNGNPKAYPYGAGVQFKVDFSRDSTTEGYVYDIQVKLDRNETANGWQALEPNRVYDVATNSKLAGGGAGYGVFENIAQKDTLSYTDSELFTEYVTNKCHLDEEGAPYSTLDFVGLDILLAGDAYQCLQEESLCECNLC